MNNRAEVKKGQTRRAPQLNTGEPVTRVPHHRKKGPGRRHAQGKRA